MALRYGFVHTRPLCLFHLSVFTTIDIYNMAQLRYFDKVKAREIIYGNTTTRPTYLNTYVYVHKAFGPFL